MARVQTVTSVYGPRKVILGYRGIERLYVHRQRQAGSSYYVTTCERPTIDSMIKIAGDYHFGTLAALNAALSKD